MRTAISPPIFISERIRSRSGGSQPDARACTHTNAAPIPTWAITVPHAEPAQAPAEAVDEQQLEHDVDRVRDDEDESGVRRSEIPRRKPWPALASMKNGAPRAAIRR